MTKAVAATQSNGFADQLPVDLGRVAGKGLAAIEAFLDNRNIERLTEKEFQRSQAFAKAGAVPFAGAVRFMQAMNNQRQIELSIRRYEALIGTPAKT